MRSMVAHAFNHSNQRQRQADFYEVNVNLVYLAHLRPVKERRKEGRKGKERKDIGLSYLRGRIRTDWKWRQEKCF